MSATVTPIRRTEIEVQGTEAMWERIATFEDQELDVDVFRDRTHACDAVASFEVPSIGLTAINTEVAEECDVCARERALERHLDAA